MYSDPRTLFQKKIQTLLKSESDVESVFENLFTVQQTLLLERTDTVDKDNWKNILEIYNIIGMKTFIKLIMALKGKTITLPTEEDMKDSILTVLCYYYKEIEGMDWKEITKLLDLPNLNTIKYGIRLRQLSQFIQSKVRGKNHGQ